MRLILKVMMSFASGEEKKDTTKYQLASEADS